MAWTFLFLLFLSLKMDADTQGASLQPESYNKHLKLVYADKNTIHKKNTKAFKDALQNQLNDFKVELLNICSGKEFNASQWLSDGHHRILLSVDQDGKHLLSKCIRALDKPELAKVLSVAFGEIKPQDLVPNLKEHTGDQKDFCFGFDDSKPIDGMMFDRCEQMRHLVTALKRSFFLNYIIGVRN